MDPEYAARYAELHATHWWWRAREAFVLDALKRRRGAVGGRILDVGCGDGLLFGELARLGEVEGVEPDAVQTFDENAVAAGRLQRFPLRRLLERLAIVNP